MKRQLILIIACIFMTGHSFGQQSDTSKTIYPTYKGLVMCGYQGWFRAPGDGSGSRGFGHYFSDLQHVGFDLWPDVREYKKTYATPFKMPDGSPARLFSSYDKSTVDLHFKWMQQYGIDGVFMQRFFSYTTHKHIQRETAVVIKNALEAASKYKRAIAIMYDLSGLKASGEDCSDIIADWKYLVDSVGVLNQKGTKTYLYYHGKPLVAIWGLGFPDRPYNIRNIGILKLINFLKYDPKYGGCSVMLGVPTFWRDLDADCLPDPYLHEIIRHADLIMPWTVQRFSPLLYEDMDRYRDLLVNDMKWCEKNHIGYVPCVYPGFSWHNLSTFAFPNNVMPVASIPRRGGKFYWEQISTALWVGAQMLYVAMFDEINEGTAIFKCTDTPPVSQYAQFAGMDGKPSDYYLWLTGQASKMLKNEEPLSVQLPERKK